MKDPAWTDLSHFCAVARLGSLSLAARAQGVSVATLSRRLRSLESTIGRRLFHHGAQGYALTAEGRDLWARTLPMEEAAVSVTRWTTGDRGPVPVRISAGTWTALYLTERLAGIWRPGDIWIPELVHGERVMDLARREVDIGLRNARPEQPWLAGRRVGTTRFAVYAASRDVAGWIGPSADWAATRSGRWVEAHHREDIVTRANAPLFAFHMARAGVGRVVLPTGVGDAAEGLVRLSDPIADLDSEQWLVAHHEARHDPPIRAALEALARAFTDVPAAAAARPLEQRGADA